MMKSRRRSRAGCTGRANRNGPERARRYGLPGRTPEPSGFEGVHDLGRLRLEGPGRGVIVVRVVVLRAYLQCPKRGSEIGGDDGI